MCKPARGRPRRAARWLAATLFAGSASLLLAVVAYRSLPRVQASSHADTSAANAGSSKGVPSCSDFSSRSKNCSQRGR